MSRPLIMHHLAEKLSEGEITVDITTEDLLENIFNKFCIEK